MTIRFSIVVPVLNEAYTINQTLAHLENRICGRDCEILVVDGHPRATTLSAIRDPRVIRVRSPRGRGIQMARGADKAKGRTLLFCHADTRLPSGALAAVDRALALPGVVGGAFALSIDAPGPAYRLISAVANQRTRLTRIPYGDQAIFMDRGLYRQIGGFRDLPLMEDVDLMQRVKRQGAAIALVDMPVRTSPRRWESEGIVRTTLRNWILISLFLMGVSPRRLARFYRAWKGD